MNANNIAFGIEFETTLPTQRHDADRRIPQRNTRSPWLPTDGKPNATRAFEPLAEIARDANSYRRSCADTTGCKQVETALDAINARGGRVNQTCGVHVTIEWNGDAAALARLISLVGNHEKAIFASTGTQTPRTKHLQQEDQTIREQRRRENNAAKRIATTF